jgi:hypothetical protein
MDQKQKAAALWVLLVASTDPATKFIEHPTTAQSLQGSHDNLEIMKRNLDRRFSIF